MTKFVPGIHRVDGFDCGHAAISQWLKDRAFEADWPDKVPVTVALNGERVVGFYALLNSTIKFKSGSLFVDLYSKRPL